MKLLIISNMSHYEKNNQIVGWGPTVQEIDALSTIFEEVTHIGCLHETEAPASSLPYQSKNISFIPLPPAGGESLVSKFKILRYSIRYIRTINKWLPWADIVHVRCPANIPLVALIVLISSRKPKYRWVKYAGNWNPEGKEAWSYTFQHWILQKNLHRGVVTINGEWPNQPKHIFSFYNPSLTSQEMQTATEIAQSKEMTLPVCLIYVGRLDSSKGVGRILEIANQLKELNFPFELELIGDGPEKNAFIQKTEEIQISPAVHFRGWLPKTEIGKYYAKAHIILFPSSSEGWPKVLSEAMAYGVVPIASTVSSIPQILKKTGAGIAIPFDQLEKYTQKIIELSTNPAQWKNYSQAGVNSAEMFSYSNYLRSVRKLVKTSWNLDLQ